MKFIGICGLKGSGKDTTADIIVQHFKYGFKESFANSLKAAMSEIFGYKYEDLLGVNPESRKWREEVDEYWSKELNKEVTPRTLMQIIGTDLLRNQLSENIWIASLHRHCQLIENDIGHECTFVIPDCRFPNEIEFIEKNDGKVIEVYREYPVDMTKITDMHESEISFMNIAKNPIRIINDSTIEELKYKVLSVL